MSEKEEEQGVSVDRYPLDRHHFNACGYDVAIADDALAAAVSGDAEAVCAVVRHYGRYITRLATQERADADGVPRRYVNEDLKNRLITRLITGILKFRMERTD